MRVAQRQRNGNRYASVTKEKAGGATYTPTGLSDFVAEQIVAAADLGSTRAVLRVLDPAVGEGELLASLLKHLPRGRGIEVYGFDTNENALKSTEARLLAAFPNIVLHLRREDFLDFVLGQCGGAMLGGLFEEEPVEKFDLVIANPPYVRTQIIGAGQAQQLASSFGLMGRVDLYYAFILAIAKVLSAEGIAGIIVSNRFMTTKAGASVRRAIRREFRLHHVWDLGDTKLFDAAVLPAVILAQGKNGKSNLATIRFSSIYETRDPAEHRGCTAIEALKYAGVVRLDDGRQFRVQQGTLDDSSDGAAVWRVATDRGDAWLAMVEAHAWRRFGDIGRVRVGVKTCADKVFIRNDWDTFPKDECPELLRPLTTHHVGRPFKSEQGEVHWQIVYPHECDGGKRRAVDLAGYPRTRAYLERHRTILEGRKYVLDAGRNWYEIWVPQDPAVWGRPKLVFRDISVRPCFWIDHAASIVNGDCYWMVAEKRGEDELLWLTAAVANSGFIEAFYDHRFNNKLYAGRRRFITQYVEEFPLPDANSSVGKAIIRKTKAIYDVAGTPEAEAMRQELDGMIWEAFGLRAEEIGR